MRTEREAERIEAGRKLFAGDWHFAHAAPSLEALPPMGATEVAFAGRSNVGKSSLINALTGRKTLARVSQTPGRTRELIFFEGPQQAGLRLVDMPGYGYAQAPEAKVSAWTTLIRKFLLGRASLARVYVLIDARHGLKEVDLDLLKTLDQAAVSYQIVLTKIDQVEVDLLKRVASDSETALEKHPAAFPEVLATSSRSGAGIAQLRAAMVLLKEERAR